MFASVLTLALLFVQSLGLVHTIAHPGNQPAGQHGLGQHASAFAWTGSPVESDTSDSGLFGGLHSCAAFDNATLAAAVHVNAVVALLAITVGMPARAALPISHIAPSLCPFRSRAPPVHLS